jgi:hypothetical protein
MVGIGLRDDGRERVPFIAFRVDPVALDLGFEPWEPEAIMRDAEGRPLVYSAADFDD